MLVTLTSIGPLLAGSWRCPAQTELAPPTGRQATVVSAERGGFGWPEHPEVQAAEEGGQPLAPARPRRLSGGRGRTRVTIFIAAFHRGLY